MSAPRGVDVSTGTTGALAGAVAGGSVGWVGFVACPRDGAAHSPPTTSIAARQVPTTPLRISLRLFCFIPKF
ncbi:MAG: hypothetical protein H7Z14_21440 [Anaerolineae bacterium]|nr:hypothetical protein [Phycisphaerae bacterium]